MFTHADHIDLDWFAQDQLGQIAHFASGGRAFIPSFWEGVELEEIYKKISQIPDQGDAQLIPQNLPKLNNPGDVNRYSLSFRIFSGRGLYSFDTESMSAVAPGYRMIAAPKRPILFGDIFVETDGSTLPMLNVNLQRCADILITEECFKNGPKAS